MKKSSSSFLWEPPFNHDYSTDRGTTGDLLEPVIFNNDDRSNNVKKLSVTLLATVLLTCSGLAFAQEKIAVFNLQLAILNMDHSQEQIKALESSEAYTALRANFEQARAELQKLADDLRKNDATWSDDRKLQQRKEIEYKRAVHELLAQRLQNENQMLMQQLLQSNLELARNTLQEVIKSEKIGLAIDGSSEAVAFANASYDITAKITDRLNKAKPKGKK